MNKFYFSLLSFSLGCLILTGCKDNDKNVTPTNENNVPNGTYKMSYSIQVLASSQNARVAGLASAEVTVSQEGNVKKATTDESGIVTFSDMREGYVSIYVKAPAGFLSFNTYDFISQNSSVDLNQTGVNAGNDSEQKSFDQYTITLARQGATLTGKIVGDFDFSGGTPDTGVPTDAQVIARISNVYQPNVFVTAPGSDGTFTFTNLPEGIAINLDLNYQSTNSTGASPVRVDWEISVPSQTLRAGQTKELGTITAN